MPAKSLALDAAYLALIFNGASIPNLADNTAMSPLTVLWVALHTASPGASGNQATSEATYVGYARQSLPRSTAGFTVNSLTGSATFAQNVTFPACTAGAEFETYFSVGTAQTGTGEILYFGPLNPVLGVQVGVTPQLSTGTVIIET